MKSRRSIARRLESVADFDEPRVDLEQYLTPSDVAAHLCHLAWLQGDLDGKTVVDLGTGTGMLAIAASFAGPDRVIGVDVDADALEVARSNEARLLERSTIDWIRADGTRAPLCVTDVTVVSNPPFGAQRGRRHGDRAFLETARELADVSYTIHNEGSLEFVESYAGDEGGTVTHAFRTPIRIERRFDFHTADSTTIDAEVFRIEWFETD